MQGLVRGGQERVREGQERVRGGQERVREGQERVREGQERVREAQERFREAQEASMKRWKGCHWLLLVSVLGVLAVVGVLVYVTRRGCCPSQAPYAHAAVAADSTNCSKVGR